MCPTAFLRRSSPRAIHSFLPDAVQLFNDVNGQGRNRRLLQRERVDEGRGGVLAPTGETREATERS
jgi:hypothetical protein